MMMPKMGFSSWDGKAMMFFWNLVYEVSSHMKVIPTEKSQDEVE
jgi:hypothetical protein